MNVTPSLIILRPSVIVVVNSIYPNRSGQSPPNLDFHETEQLSSYHLVVYYEILQKQWGRSHTKNNGLRRVILWGSGDYLLFSFNYSFSTSIGKGKEMRVILWGSVEKEIFFFYSLSTSLGITPLHHLAPVCATSTLCDTHYQLERFFFLFSSFLIKAYHEADMAQTSILGNFSNAVAASIPR